MVGVFTELFDNSKFRLIGARILQQFMKTMFCIDSPWVITRNLTMHQVVVGRYRIEQFS